MRAETKNWLGLADEDYKDSLYLFKGARYTSAIFHLCQAVEKVLKAGQIELTNSVPKKTHDLANLGKHSGITFSGEQYQVLKSLFTHFKRVRYRDLRQAHYNTKAKVQPIMDQDKEIYLWILTKLKHH
jgi:HEPN domain-containing protein